jgi:hypothetical protein
VFMMQLVSGAIDPRSANKKVSALTAIGSGLLSVFLLGCPGTLDPGITVDGGGGGGASGGCNVDTIFAAKCATSACHNASTKYAGLDLTPPVTAARVIDLHPNLGTCMNMVFLKSNSSPASGVMLDNLRPSPACGQPMPFGLPALPAADIACIQQWANGITALNGGGAGDGGP